MGENPTIVKTLEGLAARMLSLEPSDTEAIFELASILEKTLHNLPENSAAERTLILTTAEVLQSLSRIPDASKAVDAIATTAAGCAEYLANEKNKSADQFLQQAAAKLRQVLNSTSPTDDEPQSPPEIEDSPAACDEDDTTPVLPPDTDMEILAEFIVECLDHISAAEAALLELENNPDNSEQINTVFRAFHTIKGTSGFLSLSHIQRLAHLAESLLDRAREGNIRIEGGYADLSLKSCDALRTMIESLKDAQPGDELNLCDYYDDLLRQLADPETSTISDENIEEPLRVGDILVNEDAAKRQDVENAAENLNEKRIGEALVQQGTASPTDVAKALRTQKKLTARDASNSTVRVATDRLDGLINMVGELVIAQSMVAEDTETLGADKVKLIKNVTHAGKIVRELQGLSISLRMVPLKATFKKMARLVRDLAHKAGKEIQFVTEGEETEIDRNMVEVLNDPLIHMIRNCVDHGIEPADQRIAAGKEETATILLRAYHTAGNVVIELQDDGKGLNRQEIVAKAIERDLIDSDREMNDSEAFNLIFNPGFSTADKVTDISGRGVGMDVVRKGIEALRGRIETASEAGKGTTFTLRLPLTMAVADAMVLRVGSERYMLPATSIEYSFRPTEDAVTTIAGRGEMVMLHGNLLPVFRLSRLFGIDDAATDPFNALLIVIEREGRRCALMADELLGQQQVVIKSLGDSLGNIPGVSGGSILGDGRVGLILDAAGIVKLATGNTGELEAA